MRIVLIPHASSTAAIELDFLQALHENAVSAFPQILKIGSSLEDLDASDLYRIRDDVYQAVGCQFDSRLATHYAFLLASTMKVYIYIIMHVIFPWRACTARDAVVV